MKSQKKWEILHATSPEKLNRDQVRTILLENRGVKTKKEVEEFLHPKLSDVTVDHVEIDKAQLKKAVERVRNAIEKKEKIVVYGDYDVDGITGTAILWESLHSKTTEVVPYIPHRVDEGYGLSVKGITNVLEQHPDTKVIVSVDNGIVANEAVTFANEKGLEVIITDHHTVGETLPDAYAIVHTTHVCGASVGWLFAKEVIGEEENDHLSLVALATVADLVPLTGSNRTLLKYGLEILRKTTRPGLLALSKEAQIEVEKIDVYTIGHVIAPRLNAMGRLESAMDSLRLLCTTNTKRAKELADKLGATNRERQVLTSSTVEHAKQAVMHLNKKTKILFIHHESYEEGVIGLVAGKLVETFYLPAIVLSKKDDVSKASARSIAGFNIIDAIRKTSDLLVNAGGHPMAAGFTVKTENIFLLQEALEQIAEEAIDETMLLRILRIDMSLPLEMVDKTLYDVITSLSPFGMKCPEPIFVSDVVIQNVRQIGIEGKHLKLQVSPGDNKPMTYDAIAFGMGKYASDLKKGDKVQLVYAIAENTWNGRTNLQLLIKDIQS